MPFGCRLRFDAAVTVRNIMEKAMNWDQIKGQWKQYTGKAREKWGELTDDDLQRAAGGRDQLVGVVQERYGIAKEEAEKQVDSWSKELS